MLNQREREVQERAEKATAGPWIAIRVGKGVMVESIDFCGRVPFDILGANFVAHSRADVPYLLDALSRTRELLKKVRTLFDAFDGPAGLCADIDAELQGCKSDDKEG